MLKWMDKKSAVAGAVAAVIAGGALVPTFVLAQTPTESPTLEATAGTEGTSLLEDCDVLGGGVLGFGAMGFGDREVRGHGLLGAAAEEVATTLGVTVDELQAAVQSVREALKPTERPATPLTDEERAAKEAEFQTALAAELGVSVDDLAAAIEAAKPTEEEIAAAQAERLAALAEHLATAVENGRLTQEQADEVLAQAESGERPAGLGGMRRGPGGRAHFGGFDGFGGGADGGSATESSGDAA
jgi:hypothetical protein